MKHLTRQIRAPLRGALRISCLLLRGEWNVKMRWGEKCKFLKGRMDPLSPSPLSPIRFSSWSCQSLFSGVRFSARRSSCCWRSPFAATNQVCVTHTRISVTQCLCLCAQRSRHFRVLDSNIFIFLPTVTPQVLPELQWQGTESTYCSHTFKR